MVESEQCRDYSHVANRKASKETPNNETREIKSVDEKKYFVEK